MRIHLVNQLRENNLPSVPSLMQDELQTNGFLRTHIETQRNIPSMYGDSLPSASSVRIFSALREWKNNF